MISEINSGPESISISDREILYKEFTSDTFNWFYSPTTIINDKSNRSQFNHVIYHRDAAWSDKFDLVYNIFSHKIPEFKTHKLHRIKANLNVAHSNRKILPPHQDLGGREGVVYIYYVNDSDGPTTLHDGWRRIKIKPEKGKLIRFPATTWHTGNVPRKYDTRVVINFVFV